MIYGQFFIFTKLCTTFVFFKSIQVSRETGLGRRELLLDLKDSPSYLYDPRGYGLLRLAT